MEGDSKDEERGGEDQGRAEASGTGRAVDSMHDRAVAVLVELRSMAEDALSVDAAELIAHCAAAGLALCLAGAPRFPVGCLFDSNARRTQMADCGPLYAA